MGSQQQNPLDLEADSLCNEVQCSLMRSVDSTYQMPLSEHVLYSSYEFYDNLMQEQRRSLDEMMSKLTECSNLDSGAIQMPGSFRSQASHQQINSSSSRVDFSRIDNLMDKYDTINDFSEFMFDRIGQNLDDAAGLTSRDAKLVQATLEAANKNKLPNLSSEPQPASAVTNTSRNPEHKQQPAKGRQISSSSSSSSSSSTTSSSSPSPFSHSSSSHTPLGSKSNSSSSQKQTSFNKKQQQPPPPPQPPVQSKLSNQVNSVVQSSSPTQQSQQLQQHQPLIRNQFGGYMGKQQYSSPNQRYAMLENKNISRPQNQFKDKIDNSYRPFEPLIRTKPNANTPLRLYLERDEYGNEHYSHPYETEIQKFTIKEKLFLPSEPIEPPALDSTPIVLVETVKQLDELCTIVEAQEEFAVDVEHHSYRSFQGITCLLQISTRAQDFVIDAIKLRSELYRLNKSFTDSNIVKVFHGADCDILWLQRDFGIYVVNLFDTSRAAKLMKFAHLSLAFLMKHYCRFEPDKSYQLADWRERPLPLPMLQYARADTHYLLYIYDRLRNDILTKGSPTKTTGIDLLTAVYDRGREISLKRYEKPPFLETSHLSVLRKSRSTFNAKQMFAFKELYAWRDAISRELDESVGYVLPNNLMIRFSEYLPREPQGITALCNPIPPTVKRYLNDIHAIILKAIDIPLDETSKVMKSNQICQDPSLRSMDLDCINHRQDIAHSAGLQEGSVPNLLDKMYSLTCSNEEKDTDAFIGRNVDHERNIVMQHNNVNQTPSRLYNFLETSWRKSDHKQQRDGNKDKPKANVNESIQKQFVSPYNRYISRNKNN